MNDPYPDDLTPAGEFVPNTADPLVRAINRLAQAVEQNTLAILDGPKTLTAPVPVQQPQALRPLPPVQTVPQKPPCPNHGIDKVRPSDKFPGFYCTAKDPQGPRGYCSWQYRAA